MSSIPGRWLAVSHPVARSSRSCSSCTRGGSSAPGTIGQVPDSIVTPSPTSASGSSSKHHKLRAIDDETLCAFERHRASVHVPGHVTESRPEVLSCVRGFLQHLRERGVVAIVEARPQPVPLVEGFLQWMEVHRGVVESTLTSYGIYVGELVRFLGGDPRTYTARGLRDFVEKRCRHYRRNFHRGWSLPPCGCSCATSPSRASAEPGSSMR